MEASGIIRDRLGYASARLSVSVPSMDVEQLSDRKLMTVSGMGLLVCGAGSHTSCHPGVQGGLSPTGVNLNWYSGSGSCIPWHSDNESLFGPPNQPKLTVSMSLGHSVVFQVRRVPGDVPSSITLDHGDLLVMDGLSAIGVCTSHGACAAGSSG